MHTPTSLPLTLLLLLTLLAPCHGHAQAQAKVQTLTPGANEHDSNPGPNHVFQRFRPGLGSGPKAQIPLHVPSAVDLDSDLSWDTDGAEEDDDGKGGGGGGADVDVHEMLQGGVVRCGWEVMEMGAFLLFSLSLPPLSSYALRSMLYAHPTPPLHPLQRTNTTQKPSPWPA